MTQLLELKEESRTRRRDGVIVAAAVVALIVVGGVFAGARWLGSDEAARSVVPAQTEDARAVAAGFLEAKNDHDADRAMSYLTDAAIAGQFGSANGLEGKFAWERAAGWTEIGGPCDTVSTSATAVTLRCGYSVHAIGSQELGIGPYGDGYWKFTVRDGKVDAIRVEFPYTSNGFSAEVWEPFLMWVAANFPKDVDVMYVADRSDSLDTPESLRLWEQHIREYVEAKSR